MTRKQIKGLSNKELLKSIEHFSDAVGHVPATKFINSSFFWTGLFEVVKILIQLFKERKRRKLK